MPPLKNQRQEAFCLEFVKDRNGLRSYKAAGYSCPNENTAGAGAAQVLKSIKVKVRILELDAKTIKAFDRAIEKDALTKVIDKAWVVSTLVSNVDRSMQAEPVLDKDGQRTGEYQYQGNVANRGLELIGKHLGMFAEDKGTGNTNITVVNFYLPDNSRHDGSDAPTLIGSGSGEQ